MDEQLNAGKQQQYRHPQRSERNNTDQEERDHTYWQIGRTKLQSNQSNQLSYLSSRLDNNNKETPLPLATSVE